MNGNVHAAIGTGSLALLCIQHPTGFELYDGITVIPIVALVSVAFGSYTPDVDMKPMHMGQQHKLAMKTINKISGGHRGITHTLLVPTLVLAAMIMLHTTLAAYTVVDCSLQSVLFGFLYGYVLHIFADLFNGKGVPLLWPVSRSKISLMDLPSTGIVPWIFTIIFLGVQGAVMFGGRLL